MVASNAKSAPLRFRHPENGKHASIIRIENSVDLGRCTAFVISDTIAVTAAHCLTEDDTPVISPFPDKSKEYIKYSFAVYNSKGKNTFITATIYSVENVVDMGLIKGDFRGFNKMPVQQGYNLKIGDELTACGYAGGYAPPMCTGGELLSTSYFSGNMNNYIAQGMSGGPVVNKDGRAIGINTHRTISGKSIFVVLFGRLKPRKYCGRVRCN